jgi:hypothetical protein
MRKYSLYSEKGILIDSFENFDTNSIRSKVIQFLKENPTETIELCREYKRNDIRRFQGEEIIATYAVNPKTKFVSKVSYNGDKTYYMNIEGASPTNDDKDSVTIKLN